MGLSLPADTHMADMILRPETPVPSSSSSLWEQDEEEEGRRRGLVFTDLSVTRQRDGHPLLFPCEGHLPLSSVTLLCGDPETARCMVWALAGATLHLGADSTGSVLRWNGETVDAAWRRKHATFVSHHHHRQQQHDDHTSRGGGWLTVWETVRLHSQLWWRHQATARQLGLMEDLDLLVHRHTRCDVDPLLQWRTDVACALLQPPSRLRLLCLDVPLAMEPGALLCGLAHSLSSCYHEEQVVVVLGPWTGCPADATSVVWGGDTTPPQLHWGVLGPQRCVCIGSGRDVTAQLLTHRHPLQRRLGMQWAAMASASSRSRWNNAVAVRRHALPPPVGPPPPPPPPSTVGAAASTLVTIGRYWLIPRLWRHGKQRWWWDVEHSLVQLLALTLTAPASVPLGLMLVGATAPRLVPPSATTPLLPVRTTRVAELLLVTLPLHMLWTLTMTAVLRLMLTPPRTWTFVDVMRHAVAVGCARLLGSSLPCCGLDDTTALCLWTVWYAWSNTAFSPLYPLLQLVCETDPSAYVWLWAVAPALAVFTAALTWRMVVGD